MHGLSRADVPAASPHNLDPIEQMERSVRLSRNRRSSLISVAILGLLAVVGCAPGGGSEGADKSGADGKQEMIKVRLAMVSTSMGWLDLMTMKSAGLFKDAGLDVQLIGPLAAAQVPLAVAKGDADLGTSSGPAVVGAIAQGQPIRMFAAGAARPTSVLTVTNEAAAEMKAKHGATADSELSERVQAMRGLRLAAGSAGGSSYIGIQNLMSAEGLDASKDLKMVTTSSTDVATMMAAINRGDVDGMVFSVPSGLELVSQNRGVLWASGPAGEISIPGYFSLYFGNQKFVAENPEAVKRFMDALNAFHDMLKTDPSAVAAAVRGDYKDATDAIYARSMDIVKDAFIGPELDQAGIKATVDAYNDVAEKHASLDQEYAFSQYVVG
jgi:ABC-type nitrate/sulfonate/bicarbonate transport system substrate-binding protein